ncbi:hypothetical protein [Rhizobium tumorigenes]|uniref:hypothetical protein n=1 Tax=Rhizobium tumorigenes TaxID=2041385 RepID=UPI00241F4E35|nr:hypothetical protein [Rhizobium tumorigenes]WFS02767.1 hypothetical protein PR016_09270 [Rhizobium tumorigenes]
MNNLIDANGNEYPYTTLEEHGDSVTLDGGRMIQGKLSEFTVVPGKPPTVGPMQFQLLFAPMERVTAMALRKTDPVIDSFWQMIDDPRMTAVDLSLKSVQDAIEYMLTKVKAAGVSLDVAARKAAILTGQLT